MPQVSASCHSPIFRDLSAASLGSPLHLAVSFCALPFPRHTKEMGRVGLKLKRQAGFRKFGAGSPEMFAPEKISKFPVLRSPVAQLRTNAAGGDVAGEVDDDEVEGGRFGPPLHDEDVLVRVVRRTRGIER